MQKKIKSALISVFYKDGLENIVRLLHQFNVTIYSTGGTQKFINDLNIPCVPVEEITSYPSILGGRVKTLHPSVFGGILGRRSNETDLQEMKEFKIPEIDLVIVDLYPFEETVRSTADEKTIIEKIDIGGPSMIRAAAKNHGDVTVIASKDDYSKLEKIFAEQKGVISLEQRKHFATRAFQVVAQYDIAIANWFLKRPENNILINAVNGEENILRYGENPHQQGIFYGNLKEIFDQLHGKELSYNNLVDVDAAIQLIAEFNTSPFGGGKEGAVFAIIKHTNVCGVSSRKTVKEAWDKALEGDKESAFGGVLICNQAIDAATANAINEIFFEVLIAPSFNDDALEILKTKKNRILLQLKKENKTNSIQMRTVLNGLLTQQNDKENFSEPIAIGWKEVGGRESSASEKEDMIFANIICKHLKSNAIALVKNKQLIGKDCGQTSRIDALRHAVEKAKQFNFDLHGAVMASDAFFPFNDCVKTGHEEGITAFIQPGGSVRDKDSIDYCVEKNLVMVLTGTRHFKH